MISLKPLCLGIALLMPLRTDSLRPNPSVLYRYRALRERRQRPIDYTCGYLAINKIVPYRRSTDCRLLSGRCAGLIGNEQV